MTRVPKAITDHPGVEKAALGGGPDGNGPGASDYRYELFLKEGWVFTRGRTTGCRTLNCNSAKEFKYAAPKRRDGL